LQDFLSPELRAGARQAVQITIMSMPETTMHMNGRPVPWQYKVRVSGHFGGMKPEPVAFPVKETSYYAFRLCVA
jgi:hypothetical protein